MLTLTSAEMSTWVAGLMWPLARILGLITASPVFGHTRVPITVKLLLGLSLAIVIAPVVPAGPAADPASLAGFLILAQETLIGIAMGFSMRIVFGAVEFAGEISSLTMGLGFATFFDPNSQGRSSAISQYLSLVGTMLFLAVNGHLVLIEALAESFITAPISALPMGVASFKHLADWGAKIFSAGLQLSLPIVAALLITNVALGILTRAAPQLNLFGIGFPITLGAGMLVVVMTLPYLSGPLQALFNQGVEKSRQLPRDAAEQRTKLVQPRPAS
ncbi:flagellar biosynthetic protein FliR [Pseudoduganella sp. RAF53_2]|jgi:flagellar biosynthetic protein FliR|uniref:flagellar biosynthetic protein FliR n=1 Tax=unclassified Pseudoduganella TaxID=2637179 RepID=UPI003F9BD9A8